MRAPLPGELSGIGQTFGVIQDPCTQARRNANPTRAANCAADGVPANYVPPQTVEQGVAGLSGGNPNLKPEQGDTLTYGVVWTPSFAKQYASLGQLASQAARAFADAVRHRKFPGDEHSYRA